MLCPPGPPDDGPALEAATLPPRSWMEATFLSPWGAAAWPAETEELALLSRTEEEAALLSGLFSPLLEG